MKISKLKTLKKVSVTFKYSKAGASQYYDIVLQKGELPSVLPKLVAAWTKDPVDLRGVTTLEELVSVIKAYSFTPGHFSVHLLDNIPTSAYLSKTLESSIAKANDAMKEIYTSFFYAELWPDLKKCGYVQIEDEHIEKIANNKTKLMYELEAKSYTMLVGIGAVSAVSLTGELTVLAGTSYIDTIIYKTNLKYEWCKTSV